MKLHFTPLIPTIDARTLKKLLKKVRPLVRFYKEDHRESGHKVMKSRYLKIKDARRTPINKAPLAGCPRIGLQSMGLINLWFKGGKRFSPKVAEVLPQIPKEFLGTAAAFELSEGDGFLMVHREFRRSDDGALTDEPSGKGQVIFYQHPVTFYANVKKLKPITSEPKCFINGGPNFRPAPRRIS